MGGKKISLPVKIRNFYEFQAEKHFIILGFAATLRASWR